MEELVRTIAKSLVDKPDAVDVKTVEDDREITIELRVDPEDMGKVIGKQGRIAKAIRTVVKAMSAKEKKHIGNVSGQVGLKGEIKIFHFADDPQALKAYDYIIIDDFEYTVERLRYKKKIPIFKLKGVDDREGAEALYKKEVYRYLEDNEDLPAGSYYIKDLIGMKVVLAEDSSELGLIKNVTSGSAQDVYEIECVDKKILPIPAVSDFIVDVDLDNKKMTVKLPKGISELKY